MSIEKICEIILSKEKMIKDKQVKKELIFRLNDEEEVVLWNSDDEYEDFILIIRDLMNLKILTKEDYDGSDLEYFRELIKDIEVLLFKLRRNLTREVDD